MLVIYRLKESIKDHITVGRAWLRCESMKYLVCVCIFIGSYLLLSSCSAVGRGIDSYIFEKFGGTLIEDASKVTLKKVHLDNGDLIGKNIIITGKIEQIGEHVTYAVISSDAVKVVVVLTHISFVDKWLDKVKPKYINVLGQLDVIKKGYPVIVAQALQKAKEPGCREKEESLGTQTPPPLQPKEPETQEKKESLGTQTPPPVQSQPTTK